MLKLLQKEIKFMYFYRCLSKSRRLLEVPYKDLFDAIRYCLNNNDNVIWSDVSIYNYKINKFTPVFIPKIIK